MIDCLQFTEMCAKVDVPDGWAQGRHVQEVNTTEHNCLIASVFPASIFLTVIVHFVLQRKHCDELFGEW